jgi:hypothetical protein
MRVVDQVGPAVTTALAVGDTVLVVTIAPIKALCRSIRNVATTDIYTPHQAERLTTKKNLEFLGNSFTSFPNSKVFSNLGRVGIKLGTLDVVAIKK